MDVCALIKLGEGQQVEFKESFSADNEAIETLCAFSNSEGGTVLIGVSDDGKVVGASLGKNTRRTLPTNSLHPLSHLCTWA